MKNQQKAEKVVKNTTILSSSKPTKRLLTIDPGPYFKLAENQRTVIDEKTTGLVVETYESDTTGEKVYHVTLVDGELLLIPKGASCLKDSQKS